MKRILLIAVVLFFIAACTKNAGIQNDSIIGKWKLSEYLADPGDGSGTWQAADHSHPAYLEFKTDGTLVFSPHDSSNSDHYQVTSDSTIIFFRGSEKFPMRYHFSKTLLTLNPPCIEPCGEKYIPAQ